jgi:iron complex outermembrane receptor protein
MLITSNFDINSRYASFRLAAKALTVLTITMVLTAIGFSQSAMAQEGDAAAGGSAALLEEVLVTARKREESAQEVPIAITAYGSDQLEALKIRDLQNLSVAMPNVAMDDIGTFRTVANFSIRGLGINSSIPSIDPTVGVFIDGVYMGQNAGIIVDMFDIGSIEVLRGPQGTLFGRNVTGGAVLINTKGVSEEFEVSGRVAIDGNPNGDGGLNKYVMGSVSAPLGEKAGFRMSAYQNTDDGWHVNLFNGNNFGKVDTSLYRPVLELRPTEDLQFIFRWEHMESDGQGPASQNHVNGSGVQGFFANFDRDSHDFSIDNEGFSSIETDFFSFETNLDVAFGDGTVTNIFGWKDFSSYGDSDIDAQPVWLFHAPFWNYSEQFSNELRYNGKFGKAIVTGGVFWFTNEINYHERRNLLGIATGGALAAQVQDGGGDYEVDSVAVFGSVDYDLNDDWTLTAGLRFTDEEKSVKIASLIRNISVAPAFVGRCNVTEGTCPFDFVDSKSWNAVSGKLGATYTVSDGKLAYTHFSRSQRSGGYNLRNTSGDVVNNGPGPFDQEVVDNFEIGYKADLGERGRLNAAVFYNQIDDMQREVNRSDPVSGVVQILKNTADAEIFGVEVDGIFALGERTLLMLSVGWINPDYKTVRFDLNGDGMVDAADMGLDLPRSAVWTGSVGLTSDMDIGDWGYLSLRGNFSYRDDSAYTDSNLGILNEEKIIDAGIDFHPAAGQWVFSLYGRNLMNEVKHGGDTQLPNLLGPVPAGGTFSPLAKGIVVGAEVSFNY